MAMMLPDPDEPGIDVSERGHRIAMHLNAPLHPDYSERELRMMEALGSLVEFAYDVLPILKRNGIDYLLMPEHLRLIGQEFGPWVEG